MFFLPFTYLKFFQLKLIFEVTSDRSDFGFKMFPVVDLINLAGHLLSLGFYLNKKKDQKSILNDPENRY